MAEIRTVYWEQQLNEKTNSNNRVCKIDDWSLQNPAPDLTVLQTSSPTNNTPLNSTPLPFMALGSIT